MSFLYKPPCKNDKNFAFPPYINFVMKANGLWPTEGDSDSSLFRFLDIVYTCWNAFINFLVILTVAAQFLYFQRNYAEDVAQAVENMCTIMIAVIGLIRMLHMRYARAALKTVLCTFAEKIWINPQSHPHVYRRCIQKLTPVRYLTVSLVSALFLYVVTPLAILLTTSQTLESNDKRLPYLMSFPYDHQKPLYYIVTYMYTGYSSCACIIQFTVMDSIFALFVSFACGQFEILHGRIVRLIPECHAKWLKRYGDDGTASTSTRSHLQDMYMKHLQEIVGHHNDIIRFCMELENLFSFPMLANMVISSTLIGFGGLQFLVGGRNSIADFVRFLLFLLSVTGQLYVICDLGTQLIMHSTDTSLHLFMCNWEGGRISKNSPLLLHSDDVALQALNAALPSWRYINYNPTDTDFQHKLRFMIMRSHRPVQLTAMNFATLSLDTFCRILSSSLSYFALLKTFMDKRD